MIVNRTILQIQRLNTLGIRRFSTLGSASRADIIGATDSVWMGKVVKEVSESGSEEHADAINEYFRKNFRKLTLRQALDVLEPLSELEQGSANLDGQFWVWESLDEAVRPNVEELTDEEFEKTLKAWGLFSKGSNELLDRYETRMYRTLSADGPFK